VTRHSAPTTADATEIATIDPPTDSVTTHALANQIHPDLMAQFGDVLAQLATVEEDPTPRMMAAIMAAPTAESWEELFSSQSFKDMARRRIRITAIRSAESQYPESRLGIFLVCDFADLETGETSVMTCGSEMAIAQLLNCFRRGDLPHDFEVMVKDTPTRRGFRPMRLRSLGAGVTGDPATTIDSTATPVED
jgi:hypothetical protein